MDHAMPLYIGAAFCMIFTGVFFGCLQLNNIYKELKKNSIQATSRKTYRIKLVKNNQTAS